MIPVPLPCWTASLALFRWSDHQAPERPKKVRRREPEIERRLRPRGRQSDVFRDHGVALRAGQDRHLRLDAGVALGERSASGAQPATVVDGAAEAHLDPAALRKSMPKTGTARRVTLP